MAPNAPVQVTSVQPASHALSRLRSLDPIACSVESLLHLRTSFVFTLFILLGSFGGSTEGQRPRASAVQINRHFGALKPLRHHAQFQDPDLTPHRTLR